MGTTTNYGYNVPVGSNNVNLLPQMAANFPMIDSDLKAVSNAAVGTATELLTGTVHALTRSDTARNIFHFTATANFEAGETFEVDGVQVTAKTPDGQNLSTGAYVINSSVLCILDGTLLTVIVNPAKALDADKLDGHDSTYFATAGDLSVLDNQVGAISSKVGTGVLDVGNDCVDGINTLNTQLNGVLGWTTLQSVTGTTPVQLPNSFHDVKVSVSFDVGGTTIVFDYLFTSDDFTATRRHLIGCDDGSSVHAYCAVNTTANKTVTLVTVIYNTAYTTSAKVEVSYR